MSVAAPRDYPAIRQVVRHAFGGEAEANLVEQLRADSDLLFELVAVHDAASPANIVGHICYSTLTIEQEGGAVRAAALAPLSVLPAFQRRGVGGQLTRTGNQRCANLGIEAIVVLGHPQYYPRFGFSAAAVRHLQAPFSGKSFMALELAPGALAKGGAVRYARAFGL